MSISFKAKNKKRRRVHGFLKRQRTREGRNVISRRRKKGRQKLAV